MYRRVDISLAEDDAQLKLLGDMKGSRSLYEGTNGGKSDRNGNLHSVNTPVRRPLPLAQVAGGMPWHRQAAASPGDRQPCPPASQQTLSTSAPERNSSRKPSIGKRAGIYSKCRAGCNGHDYCASALFVLQMGAATRKTCITVGNFTTEVKTRDDAKSKM